MAMLAMDEIVTHSWTHQVGSLVGATNSRGDSYQFFGKFQCRTSSKTHWQPYPKTMRRTASRSPVANMTTSFCKIAIGWGPKNLFFWIVFGLALHGRRRFCDCGRKLLPIRAPLLPRLSGQKRPSADGRLTRKSLYLWRVPGRHSVGNRRRNGRACFPQRRRGYRKKGTRCDYRC